MKKYVSASSDRMDDLLYSFFEDEGLVPPRSEFEELARASEQYEYEQSYGYVYYGLPDDLISKYDLVEDLDDPGWFFNERFASY